MKELKDAVIWLIIVWCTLFWILGCINDYC